MAQNLLILELGREVLATKDRLVGLERQNAVLLAENDNLKAQIVTQKDQVENSNSTLSSQLDSVSMANWGLGYELEAWNVCGLSGRTQKPTMFNIPKGRPSQELAKEHRMCFSCLGKGRGMRDCRSEKVCGIDRSQKVHHQDLRKTAKLSVHHQRVNQVDPTREDSEDSDRIKNVDRRYYL